MSTNTVIYPDEQNDGTLTWEAGISMTGSSVLLRQLALVLGLGALVVFLLLTGLRAVDGDLTLARVGSYALISLGIFVGLMLLSAVAILLFYGNRYQQRYTLTDEGVQAVTTGGTRKRNQVVNLLLVLSGRPTAMGAGLLAHSRQSEMVRWTRVDNITTDQSRHTIALRKGQRAIMLVQCTPENYEMVLSRANQAVSNRKPRKN